MTYLSELPNEYGIMESLHECERCGQEFNVCPSQRLRADDFRYCLAPNCPSYDPKRDVDLFFPVDELPDETRRAYQEGRIRIDDRPDGEMKEAGQ